MLKRMFFKKIILICATFFAIGLLYLTPKDKIKTENEVIYIDNTNYESVYLLKDNYLTDIKVSIKSNEINSKIKELLENLKNSKGGLIPDNTKINSVLYEEGLVKIDFSKELLDVEINKEEKVIESIIYTLTSLNEISNIIIYVEGEILTKLPKSRINLPSTLNRSFGINKEYNIDDYKNIDKVTIYYINKDFNYVPVTKYYNGEKDKIKLIINELSSSYIKDSNLMSYLNSNVRLLATEQELDTLFLVFNEYIFDDMDSNNILEEVIYTINSSIRDSLDIKNVSYIVNDKEIYKSVIKTLEN